MKEQKVLKFSAPYCQPCRLMDRQILNLRNTNGTLLDIYHVDIDSNQELVNQYRVRSVPTLIRVDENGNELLRSTGSMTDDKLLRFIQT